MSWTRNEKGSSEIRVTDRRRINLNADSPSTNAAETERPSLKPTYVEELEARTKAAESKMQEVQSRFEQLRNQLQKETDETRQRLNRAADDRAEREKARFITSLLPVLDNLLRAVEAAEGTAADDLITSGVRQTADEFEKALRAAGVESIEAVGASFDPQLHEAVETKPVSPEMDGQIMAEYSRGYRMGERLLRPSRVQVGSSSVKAEEAGQ